MLKALKQSEKTLAHIQEHQCSLLNHYDKPTSSLKIEKPKRKLELTHAPSKALYYAQAKKAQFEFRSR
jgi:hypothetical protein